MLPGGPEAHMNEDLAYLPGSFVDKLVTALQVCVSYPHTLGVVGHLYSLSVRDHLCLLGINDRAL